MATKRTIKNDQLTPGKFYFIRGNVTFSRVGKLTDDAERIRYNANRKHPIEKNYTTISICNARVLAKDPKAPTIEELYAKECLYTSSNPNHTGNCFSAVNKSSILPEIRVLNESTGQYDKYNLKGRELAAGLDVIVGMRVFAGKGNTGVSLDHVIVCEPIKLYEKSSDAANAALEQLKIVFSAANPDDDDDDNNAKSETPVAKETAKPASNPPAETNDPFASISDDDEDDDDNGFESTGDIGIGPNHKY